MLLPLVLSTLALAPRPYRIAYTFSSLEPATHLADVRVEVGPREVTRSPSSCRSGIPAATRSTTTRPTSRSRPPGAAAAPPSRSSGTRPPGWCAAPRPGRRPSPTGSGGTTSTSFSQIDSTHVDLNPGNSFVYVVGHKPDPVTVRYEGPPGWRVMNGDPAPGPTYRFPNYDVMIDHPTEISAAFTSDSFVVGKVTYRMLLHAAGDPGKMRARLLGDIERIVRADVAMWGDPPIPSYTFLVHFLPGADADGMEHLTSTQLVFDDSLAALTDSAYLDRMEAIAHEFFHTWNMKRLRARELGALGLHPGEPDHDALDRGGDHQLLRGALGAPERDLGRQALPGAGRRRGDDAAGKAGPPPDERPAELVQRVAVRPGDAAAAPTSTNTIPTTTRRADRLAARSRHPRPYRRAEDPRRRHASHVAALLARSPRSYYLRAGATGTPISSRRSRT